MSGLFGNLLNAAKQIVGDRMQSAGPFQMVEIPANQLAIDGVYVRSLENQLAVLPAPQGGSSDAVVFVLNHGKSGKYHVVVRLRIGSVTKTFSVYRETNAPHVISVANRFRIFSNLFVLAENEETLKQLVDSIHSHPDWEVAHVAAAVGLATFFKTLRVGDGTTAKLLTTPSPTTGLLPLHIAVDNNRLEAVQAILTLAAASTKDADFNGMNAFHYAATINGSMVEALSKDRHAVDAANALNHASRTPLYIAVVGGKADCVAAILKAGAVGTVRCEGKTVLEAALKSSAARRAECVEAIAKKFPELAIESDANGATPLHYCDDPKILKTLVRAVGDNSAYFNVRDGVLGETPLHSAVRRADLYAAVIFIAHGSDVDAKNPDGQTPLHLSLALMQYQIKQVEILKALLVFGASCAIPDRAGLFPRHIAAINSHSPLGGQVNRVFEIADAQRCARDQRGCTDACRYRDVEVKASATAGPHAGPSSALHEMRQQWCVQRMKEKRSSKHLNLLALDGGGVKGIVLIQILLKLQGLIPEENLLEKFHWLAATSTGSIVAAALCQGRSLRDIQRLYFRLKDVVFEGWLRPYNSAVLEQFLKDEIGEKFRMSDIVRPKLIITTAMADVIPIKLALIRNYQLPLSAEENIVLGYEEPRTWPVWKAVRCSSAAPTYFSSVDNRYVDGGLVANNPTLDLITEVTNFQFAANIARNGSAQNEEDAEQVGCVVSIGCGEPPSIPVFCSTDVGLPTCIVSAIGAGIAAKNLGDILISQVTATGGRSVDRSRAWCHSMNVPFFRLSPVLFKDIPLDATDDSTLIQMAWWTMEYLHDSKPELRTLVDLLMSD